MVISRVRRALSALFAAAVLAPLAGCCTEGCIKDPPCRPCENPCCLTPMQKAALAKSTHAIQSGPVAYSIGENKYLIFTEKGLKDFEKDPVAFDEKGTRIIRDEIYRVDINPGDDFDFAALAATARPYEKKAP